MASIAGSSDSDDESCCTQLTQLTELTELDECSQDERPVKRCRSATPDRTGDVPSDAAWVLSHFQDDVYVSFGGVNQLGLARTKRMPSRYHIDSRADATRAIVAWLGREFKAFRSNSAGKRDPQQLRGQPIGAVTLYFNWGGDAVVGLRKKTRDQSWPQQPLQLKSRTGLLLAKQETNSIMVSLCKGDADCFWAFEGQEDDDSDPAEEGAPVEKLIDGATGSDTEEPEGEPPRQKVLIKSLPCLHQHQGLKGYMVASPHVAKKHLIAFPCGAPSKLFAAQHFDRLPEDASMNDRLTAGKEVWLARGPGMGPWAMSHLRGQKAKRAVARMLGWNAYHKRFVLTLDDRMEERHIVHLTFAQTGIVQSIQSWAPAAADADSDDPKACSDSSDEK